jgi:hypothetical protein
MGKTPHFCVLSIRPTYSLVPRRESREGGNIIELRDEAARRADPGTGVPRIVCRMFRQPSLHNPVAFSLCRPGTHTTCEPKAMTCGMDHN